MTSPAGAGAKVIQLNPLRAYDRASALLATAREFADHAYKGDLVAALRAKMLAEQAEKILSSIFSIHRSPRDDLDRWCFRDSGDAMTLFYRMRSLLRRARRRRPILRSTARLLAAPPVNDARAA